MTPCCTTFNWIMITQTNTVAVSPRVPVCMLMFQLLVVYPAKRGEDETRKKQQGGGGEGEGRSREKRMKERLKRGWKNIKGSMKGEK